MTEKIQEWSVYVLRCSDGSYYTGVATDVTDRVKEHNAGQGASYTRKRRPVQLVYSEKHGGYMSARKREEQLKGWRREKKEWLIKGFPSTRRPDLLPSVCPDAHTGPSGGKRLLELRVEDRTRR